MYNFFEHPHIDKSSPISKRLRHLKGKKEQDKKDILNIVKFLKVKNKADTDRVFKILNEWTPHRYRRSYLRELAETDFSESMDIAERLVSEGIFLGNPFKFDITITKLEDEGIQPVE